MFQSQLIHNILLREFYHFIAEALSCLDLIEPVYILV
jgi:hypothetical protein